MKILVLGGDGFMGSHTIDRLVQLGHDVTVFDRFPYVVSKNLEHQRDRIDFIAGEFANRDTLSRAVEGQDIVYHFISATTPATSWNDPFIEIDENIRSTVQFLEIAASKSIRKVVFMSSGGTVYSKVGGLITEKCLPQPCNPYGIGKLAVELFMNYYRAKTRMAVDIFRIGNAYGPRQPMNTPQGVISVWMAQILRGEEIIVYGDSTTCRDYVFVGDVADLLTWSVINPERSELFNVGTGRGVSVLELLKIFQAVIPVTFKYRVLPRRNFDNTSVVLDGRKIQSLFRNFEYSRLEEKLPETWEYACSSAR